VTQPVRAAGPPRSHPSWRFCEALPELTRISAGLDAALLPAMTTGREDGRGFAETAWMLAKALRFLLDAAQSDDPAAFDAALAEVDADALAAAGHARGLRAAAALPEELAAAGETARAAGYPAECAATSAVVGIVTGSGRAAEQIQVQLDADGRASWQSDRHGQLAVDGRTQLDLAAALDLLAEAYWRAGFPSRP
jgi:hypothetical protein